MQLIFIEIKHTKTTYVQHYSNPSDQSYKLYGHHQAQKFPQHSGTYIHYHQEEERYSLLTQFQFSLAPNTGEHSAQQGEAAAQPPEDVHGHRRPPLALDQLEEADIVVDEAVVAGEVAPAAAAEATAVVSARVVDVPRPPPAGSLKNDLFADCYQVLACKF